MSDFSFIQAVSAPRLTIGGESVHPLNVRRLSRAEWTQLLLVSDASNTEDHLYFHADGAVHDASFAMETRLTDVIKRAFERGRLVIEYEGLPGVFLRSEDVDRFDTRHAAKSESV